MAKGNIKKSGIYFDNEPIEGSDNAITSGAVATAIGQGGGGGTDYGPRITALESKTVAMESDIAGNTQNIGAVDSKIGTLENLTTTVKTDVVSAINEVKADIPDVTGLATTASVNAVDGKIGTLENLTTTAKTDTVSAINEVKADIPDVSTLATTASVNAVDGKIGTLENLTTTAKTDIVSAINEVASSGGSGGGADGVSCLFTQTITEDISKVSTTVSARTYYGFTESSLLDYLVTKGKISDKSKYRICRLDGYCIDGTLGGANTPRFVKYSTNWYDVSMNLVQASTISYAFIFYMPK